MSAETTFQFSDERVREATGRPRDEWFALLDEAGAADMTHSEIAAWLVESHGVAGWWAQTVTVDYEKARGRRRAHERSDGFGISKSRTLGAPVDVVFEAWADDAARAGWLDDKLEVTSAQEHRTVRGRWADGPTRVAVYLTEKAPGKTQVQVQHEKLPDAEAAEAAKQAWAERLSSLASWLEAREG